MTRAHLQVTGGFQEGSLSSALFLAKYTEAHREFTQLVPNTLVDL